MDGDSKNGKGLYNYYKGVYLLHQNQTDSAIYYFRKANARGLLEAGNKGLLSAYEQKRIPDSIAKYARLYATGNDSTFMLVNQNMIHQISAQYKYTRQQRIAEQERDNTRKARFMLGVFILITLVLMGLIGVISWIYRRRQQKKREKICKLEKDLEDTMLIRSEIQEELKKLKSNDYESVIAAKEKKEEELTLAIERLQKENSIYKNKETTKEIDRLEDFRSSRIAQLFVMKANGKYKAPRPSEAEWRMLMSQFSKDIPVTFKSFGEGKSLSQLEQRICVLLILDISEKIISIMTDSVASTVSNAKARANEKLYGKKVAHSLKTNLLHALKRS